MDETFLGSYELHLYLKKLIKITDKRIEGLYEVRKKRLNESQERSNYYNSQSSMRDTYTNRDMESKLMKL